MTRGLSRRTAPLLAAGALLSSLWLGVGPAPPPPPPPPPRGGGARAPPPGGDDHHNERGGGHPPPPRPPGDDGEGGGGGTWGAGGAHPPPHGGPRGKGGFWFRRPGGAPGDLPVRRPRGRGVGRPGVGFPAPLIGLASVRRHPPLRQGRVSSFSSP